MKRRIKKLEMEKPYLVIRFILWFVVEAVLFPQSFPSEGNHYLMWINLDIQNFFYLIICFWKNNSAMGQDMRENHSSCSLIFLFLDVGLFIVPLSLISTINSLLSLTKFELTIDVFNCLYQLIQTDTTIYLPLLL